MAVALGRETRASGSTSARRGRRWPRARWEDERMPPAVPPVSVPIPRRRGEALMPVIRRSIIEDTFSEAEKRGVIEGFKNGKPITTEQAKSFSAGRGSL